VIAFRPEASVIYVNASAVLETVLNHLGAAGASGVRRMVCDLSASPYVDLAGSRMLHELHGELAARGIALRIVGARGRVRDLLRADGVGEKVGGLDRAVTLESLLGGDGGEGDAFQPSQAFLDEAHPSAAARLLCPQPRGPHRAGPHAV